MTEGTYIVANTWLDDIDTINSVTRGIFGVLEAGISDGLSADAVGYLLRDQTRLMGAIERIDGCLHELVRPKSPYVHNEWLGLDDQVNVDDRR